MSKPSRFSHSLSINTIALAMVFFASGSIRAELNESVLEVSNATTFVSLSVYPPKITLDHHDDFQKTIVIAAQADGMTLDVTQTASSRLQPVGEAVNAIALEQGKLFANGNGEAQLIVEFAGLQTTAEVVARNFETQKPASFQHDVMPVFLRAGCNTGGCHGSAQGKDGFRLGLFGYDPAGDHYRLTREMATRRVNVAFPDESLLLMKSIGAVPHTGGKRFESDSVYYSMLRNWIASGAGNDVDSAAKVDSLELFPPAAALNSNGSPQQFIAVANYSDGSTRDVSHLVVFLSNNETSAAVDVDGLVTPGSRGEAFITARFDTHTVGSQVLVLPTGVQFQPIEEGHVNYIDELVAEKLRTLRIHPSPVCSDEQYLRRVTIDVAGRLPTREEFDAFLANDNPKKRGAKIDELLAGPEFAKLWGLKWSELLLVRSQPNVVEYKPMFLYSQWLTDQIAQDRPLDDIFRELLSASGSTFDNPPVNFYQIERDPKKIAENVAQIFLGIRVQCAQCHNHAFDRWTMDDYYSFTAFFSQIARKSGEDYREQMIYNRGGGERKNPVSGKVMKPKFLGGIEPDTAGKDRRAVLAEWVVSPENPYFAKNVANRVWAHSFGIGIVNPVDDVRVSNPASNQALLDALASHLVDYGFNLRQLVRDICSSNTYQRCEIANETNATDLSNFARSYPRRIPAEVLLDCLSQATGSPEKLPGLPLGAKALEISDGSSGNYFLTTFGRSKRETVCACEAQTEPTLSQALHLLNGTSVSGKITGGGLIAKWQGDGKTPSDIIDEIYITCLSRNPTEEERADLVATIQDPAEASKSLEDIFWAVLNSREFLFNH